MPADDSGGSGYAGGALVAAENSGIRGLQGEAAGMVADALALPAARVGLLDGLTAMHSYVARMVHAKPYLIKRAPRAQSSHEPTSVESAMTIHKVAAVNRNEHGSKLRPIAAYAQPEPFHRPPGLWPWYGCHLRPAKHRRPVAGTR